MDGWPSPKLLPELVSSSLQLGHWPLCHPVLNLYREIIDPVQGPNPLESQMLAPTVDTDGSGIYNCKPVSISLVPGCIQPEILLLDIRNDGKHTGRSQRAYRNC